MKKFISIMVAMVIMMSSISAFAITIGKGQMPFENATVIEGDFSVRNGIKMGMTIQEIQEIELHENGNNPPSGMWGISTAKTETMGRTTMMNYSEKVLAGIECEKAMSSLVYYVGNDGLISIVYCFGSQGNDTYDELFSTLKEKYGEPLINNQDELLPLITPAYNPYFYENGRYRIKTHAEWLLDYDDTYIVLDLVHYNDNHMYLGYRGILKETEIKPAISEAEKAASRDSDI